MKRAIDVALSLTALIVTMPVMVLAALLVWLWDFRSPVYVSLRVRDPRSTFPMYKFRSMIPGADLRGGASTAGNDRRLTSIGRVLRALKIDELPQMWNVLVGDMSLVGPRAQVVQGAVLYTAQENRLFDVRPGITDFASIVFADEGDILAEHDDPDTAYNTLIRPWKSRLGLAYVEHRRVWVDCALILLTLVAIASKRRARRGVQAVLRQLGVAESLVRVAGRDQPLEMIVPPGGLIPAANGPYLPLSLSERAHWIQGFEQLRRGPIIAIHLLLIVAANVIAWMLHYEGRLGPAETALMYQGLSWLILIRAVTFGPFRLYQGLWRYTGVYDLQALIAGVASSSILFLITTMFLIPGYPRSIMVVDALVLTFLLGGVRMMRRMYAEFGSWAPGTRDVLIYGAGSIGEGAARLMRADRSGGRRPIGFIDDDPTKIGLRIHSVPVLGGRAHLASILAKSDAEEILIAKRGAEDALKTVTDVLDERGIDVRLAPGFDPSSVRDLNADKAAFESTTPPVGSEDGTRTAGDATVAARPEPLATRCPSCRVGQAHRSHARSYFERARKGWSDKRIYRCHECGWRGWLLPIENAADWAPLGESRVDFSLADLKSLDDDLASSPLVTHDQ